MSDIPSTEFVHDHRILIAIAEACQRPESPSYSWHVFDWVAWRLRWKYPAVRKGYAIINRDSMIT